MPVDESVLTTCPRDCYDACGVEVVKRDGVIRHVRGTEKISRESAAVILEGYLAAMERLVAYLNEFRG